MKSMESLFYLRWDKGREAMAAAQSIHSFLSILLFLTGRMKKRIELKSIAAPKEWMSEIDFLFFLFGGL